MERQRLDFDHYDKGPRTPWGTADYGYVYGEGVIFYGTPGHGGFKLDAKRNKLVPAVWRRKGGWYEEDLEWAIVAVVFPELFEEKEREGAESTLERWFPKQYKLWKGISTEEELNLIYNDAMRRLHDYLDSAFGRVDKTLSDRDIWFLLRDEGVNFLEESFPGTFGFSEKMDMVQGLLAKSNLKFR